MALSNASKEKEVGDLAISLVMRLETSSSRPNLFAPSQRECDYKE